MEPIGYLPPYGIFSGYYRDLALGDFIMTDWEPDRAEDERKVSFQNWRVDHLNEINDVIWPSYDSVSGEWIGKSAKFMELLTKSELQIMVEEFNLGLPHAEINKRPSAEYGIGDIDTHLYHFRVEDDVSIPAGENFDQYFDGLATSEHESFKELAAKALGEGENTATKSAGLFWFKGNLQRPRPFQAALLLDQEAFSCEIAKTSFHSSAHSGHCLQGVLLGCAVYEGWRRAGLDLDRGRNVYVALAQYMVDWGDRRVIAGVHYPSDNIASWSIALSLVPKIFENGDEVLQFLNFAVQERSRVFDVVRSQYSENECLNRVRAFLTSKLGSYPIFA